MFNQGLVTWNRSIFLGFGNNLKIRQVYFDARKSSDRFIPFTEKKPAFEYSALKLPPLYFLGSLASDIRTAVDS